MLASSLLLLSLRLANPHEVPVDALLRCGDAVRNVTVGARDVVDVDVEGCTDAEASLPLTVLELAGDGEERQRLIAACDVPPMWVPSFACRNGTATAYVEPVDGASYAWTVEGATIVGGAGTHRVTVQLTDPAQVTLRVRRSSDACSSEASGVIHVREPIVVKDFLVPGDVPADQPVTLRWSYEPGREPNAQLLAGDAFPQPVPLSAAQRSYTFTPKSSGARTIELRASYARTIVTATPRRRRAAGGAMTSATECPAVRAAAKMNVTGCSDAPVAVTVPEDVLAGATFVATVPVGGEVEWSVENGTIKSTSPFKEMIEVVAGAGGKVRISARIEQRPGCFVSADAEVPILLSAERCAVPPSATLNVAARECGRARVVATLSGTPPFAGRWSDGREFRTAGNVVTNDFVSPGDYTITDFHDASCYGTATSVHVETLRPSVRLEELSNSCGVVRFAAHFTGVPPFTAVWSDWEPIHTMERRIERTVRVPGGWNDSNEWQIHNFRDAICDFAPASNVLRPAPAAESGVTGVPHCQTSPHSGATVYVSGHRGNGHGFHGPIVAEWADGTVTSSTTNVAIRTLPPISTPSASFELKRVTFAGCEADLTGTTANVIYRPTATVAAIADPFVCMGDPVTARIGLAPSAEGVLRWNARGQYAQIVASPLDGNEFTFTSRLPGYVWVSVATDHIDGKCNGKSSEIQVHFGEIRELINARLDPDVIPAGGATRITWENGMSSIVPRIILPPGRESGLVAQPTVSGGAMFVDKVGPGTVPITLEWSDCRGTHQKTLTLTIVP